MDKMEAEETCVELMNSKRRELKRYHLIIIAPDFDEVFSLFYASSSPNPPL